MSERHPSPVLTAEHTSDLQKFEVPVTFVPSEQTAADEHYKVDLFKDSKIALLSAEVNSLHERSLIDDVTELKNSKALHNDIPRFFEHARQTGESYWILAIDLDNFKLANDQYGHPVGDKILHLVGEVLNEQLYPNDVSYRKGGDEFVSALVGSDSDQEALRDKLTQRLNQGLHEKIKDRLPAVAENLSVGMSVGLAKWSPSVGEESPEGSWKQAFNHADQDSITQKRLRKATGNLSR